MWILLASGRNGVLFKRGEVDYGNSFEWLYAVVRLSGRRQLTIDILRWEHSAAAS